VRETLAPGWPLFSCRANACCVWAFCLNCQVVAAPVSISGSSHGLRVRRRLVQPIDVACPIDRRSVGLEQELKQRVAVFLGVADDPTLKEYRSVDTSNCSADRFLL
jgi:hypothetical protein